MSTSPPGSRFAAATAVVAFVALLVGVAIGIGATIPQRNELQRQSTDLEAVRAERQATREELQATVDEVEARVAKLQTELDATTSAGQKAAKVQETCSKAATDTSDLIFQYDNYLGDLFQASELAPGSADQKRIFDHLKNQDATMNSQQQITTDQLTACQSALHG